MVNASFINPPLIFFLRFPFVCVCVFSPPGRLPVCVFPPGRLPVAAGVDLTSMLKKGFCQCTRLYLTLELIKQGFFIFFFFFFFYNEFYPYGHGCARTPFLRRLENSLYVS